MVRLPHLLRYIALLLLFWAAVIHFLVVLPPFEGSDEDKHFGYITHLRQTGQLPDPRQSLQLPARQASGQAPLYYLLVRLWSELAPPYTWDGSLPLNPYANPNRPVMSWPDNANVFLFGPDHIPYNPPLVQALMWQRFLSPLLGMLAVSLAYSASRLLFSRTWSRFVMLLFAFNPVLIFMFSYVTNDAAAILASAAITFCLMLLLRRPVTPRSLLLTGVVVGLGTLTKANVLVFAPIAMLAAAFRSEAVHPRLERHNVRRTKAVAVSPDAASIRPGSFGSPLKAALSTHTRRACFSRLFSSSRSLRRYPGFSAARRLNVWRLLLLALPILLTGAPWYVWNALQYGDPLGIQPHLRTFWALPRPRSMGEALLLTLHNNAYQLRSLWYGVASGVVMSTHSVIFAPVALLILAVIGYTRCWRELVHRYRLALLTLGLICAVIFIAYARWLTLFDSVTGRLLLPGYPALALLVTMGLAHGGWRPNLMRAVRLVSGAAIAFGAVIVTGHITLPWFYTMRTISPEDVPALSGERAHFGDVEFLGYHIEPEKLSEGVLPRATVCWRSLREDDRLPVPYAFAFHITAQDGTVYYGRDSLPGLGLYTYWQPGRAFCDRFTMEQRHTLVPGHGYRVAIGLFDPATLERVPENDGKTFAGWIAAPAGRLTEAERASAPYNFEEVYLLNVSFSQSRESFSVWTEWGTGDWQPRPLTIFIHVLDADGQLVTQLDLPLGEDDYPTILWGDHERTYSAAYFPIPIPEGLPPGEYPLLLGLYDSETLARRAVVDAEGVAQADNVVRIGALRIAALPLDVQNVQLPVISTNFGY